MYLARLDLPQHGWTAAELGPSPGLLEIATTEVWWPRDQKSRIVRYLSTPDTVVVHLIDEKFVISTQVSTTWDYAVTDATIANVNNHGSATGTIDNGFLTADGDVYSWTPGPLPEVDSFYFGSVGPGARRIVASENGYDENDWMVLMSSGEIVYMANNGSDKALAAQRIQLGPPCEVCLMKGWKGSRYFLVALDDHVYLLHLE
jgi:hypothetical protein